MRLSLILFALACFAQTQERSAVAGRVVSAVTGAPLKKASVWLEPFSPTRGVNGAPSVSLPAATTDAEGRFTLDDVEPGSYFLLAQRVGYLDQGYGAPDPQVVGPPLDLTAGQTLRDVTLKLTPQSLVYGKVVDEDGDPIPNAEVHVLRTSYAGGRRHLIAAAAADSQDDGSFVIGNLTPGRYYLSAAMRKLEVTGPPVRKVERETYMPTYFPSASDASAASPVEVSPGAEVRGLAIRLRKSRVFHIRGRALNAETSGPAARLFLRLVPKNGSIAESGSERFDRDGRQFRIRRSSARNLYRGDQHVRPVRHRSWRGASSLAGRDAHRARHGRGDRWRRRRRGASGRCRPSGHRRDQGRGSRADFVEAWRRSRTGAARREFRDQSSPA